jgi:hypothetical protein
MGQTPAAVDTVLDFHVMAPVAGTFVGTANPVRGVPGGGLPRVIAHGDGTLRSDGSLEVNVQGLVLPTGCGRSEESTCGRESSAGATGVRRRPVSGTR